MAIDLPRETALKILYDINENGAYTNIALNKYLEETNLKGVDRSFITDMVYGTIKWRLSIDYIIEIFSSVKLKKISPWILNVLRLGVYQLLYTDKIPESAAVNESVNLSKRYGHAAASRYVNGVLRSVSRNRQSIEYPDKAKNLVQYLSVKYSHPDWLVKDWVKRFGKEFTEDLLQSNNQVPEVTVRTNTLKISKDELAGSLKEQGIEAEQAKYVEEALIVRNPSSIARLEAFKKGYFQVQDESSMLVAKVMAPERGDTVIDVCSAPGGKTTHIAQLMKDEGTVIARDVHEHKIRLVAEACERLGIKSVKPQLYDAMELDESFVGKADKVLVDAPCTGFGIIRRKPDIKWTRTISDINEINALQAKILDVSSRYVKPGGVLVYSTCTILDEENQGIIKKFLKEHDEFELTDITGYLPERLRKTSAAEGYIQLFPNVDNIDGFFIARLIKRR